MCTGRAHKSGADADNISRRRTRCSRFAPVERAQRHQSDRQSRADFLLYLPLDLPLSDKQARCEAAKERMTLMLRLKSSLPPQSESSKAVEEMPVWAEAARRLLPSPSPAPAIDSD